MTFRREKVPGVTAGVTACRYCALFVLFFIRAENIVSAQVTPIPSTSWHQFVEECLAEAPVTGKCTTWATFKNWGTMPNWDVSLVEDMRGYDDGKYIGFGGKSTFNGNISNWDTASVTDMQSMFSEASALPLRVNPLSDPLSLKTPLSKLLADGLRHAPILFEV